jgi:hypothetical protein
MSCPFLKDHSSDLFPKSEDNKCPAKDCPILKNYVAQKKVVNQETKCPFKKYHNCPYFKNMENKYKK